MEQCIKQNNALEIYEDYFEVIDEATQCQVPEAKTVHVFRDPTPSSYLRPVADISWCPDGGSRLAIAYCNLEFQAAHPDTLRESYIFHIGMDYTWELYVVWTLIGNSCSKHELETEPARS